MIEANAMHFGGLHNERRFVLAIEGEAVRYALPISREERQCSVTEFEAWRAKVSLEENA